MTLEGFKGEIKAHTETATMLWHKDFPNGKVFKDAVTDFEQLAKDGWVNGPHKLIEEIEDEYEIVKSKAIELGIKVTGLMKLDTIKRKIEEIENGDNSGTDN